MTPHLVTLLDLKNQDDLLSLLNRFADIGGVIDYVPLPFSGTPNQNDHYQAALRAMGLIDEGYKHWAAEYATESRPESSFFTLTQDDSKLKGDRIQFSEFWGSNNVSKRKVGPNSWTIPNVDGYKGCFFLPPYGLYGNEDFSALFDEINFNLFGVEPERWVIYRWSTDWSNYFDAGHEWWGAFYWTVYSAETSLLTTVGASSTD